VRLLNQLAGAVAAALLYPFRDLPPIVGLAFVSLLTSIAILLVFRRTSDQAALQRVKNRIVAGILEILLFRDDLRLIMRAQRDILRSSFTYFRLSLVPMLWVILPVLLLMIQLQFHYGYRALEPGQSAILRVNLAAELDSTAASRLMLEASDEVAVATPLLPVRSESFVKSSRFIFIAICPCCFLPSPMARLGGYQVRDARSSQSASSV